MDQKEVVFKVEVDKYESFKRACKEAGTIPAAALRKLMQDYVVKNNVAEKSVYRLIWMNLCNGPSKRYLQGDLSQEERVSKFLNIISRETPDAIVFHEFAPATCDGIVEALTKEGYEFYYPEGYTRASDGRKTAVAALAVVNGCEFEQEFLDDVELSYRYVCGSLKKEGDHEVFLLLPHIPAAEKGANEVALRRKANMLKKILRHSLIRDSLNLLTVGGFNSVIRDKADVRMDDEICFGELVKHLVDTSVKKRPTVREQRLDFCFANASMNNKYSVTTEEIEVVKTISDHSYLRIEIKERSNSNE